MKRNPTKSKIKRETNLSKVFETVSANDLKVTIANAEYTQLLKRNWADFNTSVKKAV